MLPLLLLLVVLLDRLLEVVLPSFTSFRWCCFLLLHLGGAAVPSSDHKIELCGKCNANFQKLIKNKWEEGFDEVTSSRAVVGRSFWECCCCFSPCRRCCFGWCCCWEIPSFIGVVLLSSPGRCCLTSMLLLGGAAFLLSLWVVLLSLSPSWMVLFVPHASFGWCCVPPPPLSGAAVHFSTTFF